MIEWKEGPLVAHVLHLLLPFSTRQQLSQSPQTGKMKAFSLLCYYQEIIICCSMFHADNQDLHDKLPLWGVKTTLKGPFIYNKSPILDSAMGRGCNWFAKHISSIIYLLCLESRALILIVQGQIAVKDPGAEPAETQPNTVSLPQLYSSPLFCSTSTALLWLPNLRCQSCK